MVVDSKLISKWLLEHIPKDVPYVTSISNHMLNAGGRNIRARLIVLLQQALGGSINDKMRYGAIFVEILHNATLLHDDVVDLTETRRGKPTAQSIWNNKISILTGDFLFTQANSLLPKISDNSELVSIVAKLTSDLAFGELLQLKVKCDFNINFNLYLDIISKKTAALFELCAHIVKYTLELDDVISAKLVRFFNNYGIAYQIIDDVLDYLPSIDTGKPSGQDIAENKITAPLIFYMNHVDCPIDASQLKMLLKEEKYSTILELVRNSNALDLAYGLSQKYVAKAVNELDFLSESCYKVEIIDLIVSSLRVEIPEVL